jgi:hypothetical protein
MGHSCNTGRTEAWRNSPATIKESCERIVCAARLSMHNARCPAEKYLVNNIAV